MIRWAHFLAARCYVEEQTHIRAGRSFSLFYCHTCKDYELKTSRALRRAEAQIRRAAESGSEGQEMTCLVALSHCF